MNRLTVAKFTVILFGSKDVMKSFVNEMATAIWLYAHRDSNCVSFFPKTNAVLPRYFLSPLEERKNTFFQGDTYSSSVYFVDR
jgi:hypothetical protein